MPFYNILYQIIQIIRRKRYNFTLFISKFISFFLKKLPRHERQEIIFPTPSQKSFKRNDKLVDKGILISEFKNQSSLNTLKSLEKQLKIYEKSLPKTLKLKIDNFQEKEHKSFLKTITKYFSKSSLLELAYDPDIYQSIYSYFGFYPSICRIHVWHTERTSDMPSTTQFFHRDPEDMRLLKLFIPLAKIENKNGPFQFISGSHKKYFKEDFSSMNRKRFGNERIDFEKLLVNKHKDQIISFTGDVGSYCLADTNGLHRGLLPENGRRYLINIIYTSSLPEPLPEKIEIFS